VKLWYEWDWGGCDREFARAIELNPNYAPARHWRAEFLMASGRLEEAAEEIDRAHVLDPYSLVVTTWKGMPAFFGRDYARAAEQFRVALGMDADFYPARINLARAYLQLGRFDDAIAEFQTARTVDDTPWVVALLGHAYGVAGRTDQARQILAELGNTSRYPNVSAYGLATLYLGLGLLDEALEGLAGAVEERTEGLIWLRVEPRWDPLRTHPRFIELLGKVGIGREASTLQQAN